MAIELPDQRISLFLDHPKMPRIEQPQLVTVRPQMNRIGMSHPTAAVPGRIIGSARIGRTRDRSEELQQTRCQTGVYASGTITIMATTQTASQDQVKRRRIGHLFGQHGHRAQQTRRKQGNARLRWPTISSHR